MKQLILFFFLSISINAFSQEIFLLNNMILIENCNEVLNFKNNIPQNWNVKHSTVDKIVYPEKWVLKKEQSGKFITYSNLRRASKNKKIGYFYKIKNRLYDKKIVVIDSIPSYKFKLDFGSNPTIYTQKNNIIISEIRNKEWDLIYKNDKNKIFKHKKRNDYLFTNKTLKDYELAIHILRSSTDIQIKKVSIDTLSGDYILKMLAKHESKIKKNIINY